MKPLLMPLLLALALVAASCGGSETAATPATTPSTTLGPTSSTTTAAPGTTTAAPSTTTTAPSSSTAAPAPTLPPPPALDDGRPETFVAVTNDFEAVEVDTATGAIITSFGRLASAADLRDGDEIAPNVIDSVWRTIDGSYTIVSECCEPAGGSIWYLEPGQQLDRDRSGDLINSDGWLAAPSPATRQVAVIGYFLRVGEPGALETVWSDPAGEDYPSGSPAWRRDRSGIYWLGSKGGTASGLQVHHLDLATSELTLSPLPWVGDRFLDGLAVQASGNLVGFLRDGYEPTDEVTGVVFTPEGGLIAEFPLEPGSRLGGYDASGTFLIYVDGTGTVRWQGGGGSGSVAEGFVFASW